MVETLRPELLPREISVKADLPQIAYRWAAVHAVLLLALPGYHSGWTFMTLLKGKVAVMGVWSGCIKVDLPDTLWWCPV